MQAVSSYITPDNPWGKVEKVTIQLMSSNTTRIAKNTLMLYFRQILIMLVNLYTVRVVLETLGAEDYGIYNVVAGVVTMFGFLSNSMATATQRYLSFELGRNDFEQLKKVFSISLEIYILIAVLVIVLAETVGLWFVSNKLLMPLERKNAAWWIYQFSILSFLFTILAMPYMAVIIAHEDMNIYAGVSIADVVLKLAIVFLLRFIVLDKLQLYGILICAATFINTAIYRIICQKKYKECKFIFYWNKDLFKEITNYTIWNLFGASVGVFKTQAVNILLNQFFNPVVIAARGITSSVNAAIVSFSANFSVALRPQIIKNYAAREEVKMLWLVFNGAKCTFFLMLMFTLPFILEMPILLSLWLKKPPEYAVLFTRLALVDALMDSISYPIITAVQATGKVKLYQSVVSGILLLNLPVSWIVLLLGMPVYTIMIVAICLTCIGVIARFLILKQLINYSLIQFFRIVIIPVCIVTVLSVILPIVLYIILQESLLRLCLVFCVSIFSIGVCIYIFGLNNFERQKIINQIKKRGFLRCLMK
jgi:O-antigen/teichoic acid export membrane protein